MRALVTVRCGEQTATLGPGDLIGRLSSAALTIDDPRVSEAHAMVSLRHGSLWLLSLRRMIAVGGKPLSTLRLVAPMTVELANGVELHIEDVSLPGDVLAITAPGLGIRVLSQVSSLWAERPPRVANRFDPSASGHIWWRGDAWRASDGKRQWVVEEGDVVDLNGTKFELCAASLATAGEPSTRLEGAIAAPLKIVAHFDSVELHQRGRPVCVLGGIGARIVSELVALDGPVAWAVAAREVWPDAADSSELRRRWDAALNRLRAKLRQATIRGDLLRADGSGAVQLVLYDGDTVEDRT